MPVHVPSTDTRAVGVPDPPVAGTGVHAGRRQVLADIVAHGDPAAANRLITRAHHELGELLATVIGRDAGPNFHTWAVWGSREAGRTIARRDIAGLTGWVALAGAVTGLGVGAVTGLLPVLLALLLATAAGAATRAGLNRSRRHIAHGNRIVLDEIGSATVDYLDATSRESRGDAGAVEDFLTELASVPPGEVQRDLLVRAFRAYDRARRSSDPIRRHQLVFAANCFAVRHEHVRLQHDIASSMLRPLRRPITRHLLDFWVGDESLHVARDLTPVDGAAFPPSLDDLVEPEAIAAVELLRDRARPDDSLTGSAARDWADFDQRMNYVVDLFRSRHHSERVWAEPYPGTSDRLLR